MVTIPSPENITLFLTAAVILIVIPGPAVLYVTSKSMEQGYKAGFISVLGIGTGGLVHVLAAGIGLSALLVASAMAFSILKYLGALYLIYLGVKKMLGKSTPISQQVVFKQQKLSKIYFEGALVNILNPKTAIFFLAFLPQFVSIQRGGIISQIIFLGLLFIVIAIFSDSFYVLISGRLAIWMERHPFYDKVQKYLIGAVYILLELITLTTSKPSQSFQK